MQVVSIRCRLCSVEHMALPALASSMADNLMQRTVQMCVTLEGVAWTIDAVRTAAMTTIVAAGFEESGSGDHVAVEEVARRMQVAEHVALWQLRAAGLEPSTSLGGASSVSCLRRKQEAAADTTSERNCAVEAAGTALERPRSRPSSCSSSPSPSQMEGDAVW